MFRTIGAMAVDIKGTPEEIFKRTKGYGCNAVELVIGVNAKKEEMPAVKEAAAATGVQVLAFNRLIRGLSSFDAAAVEAGTREYHTLLDCCAECRAPYAVVYCFFEKKDGETAKCVAQFAKNFRPLLKRAEKEGVTVLLENEPSGISNDPRTCVRIIEEMNSPKFKLNFDPDNFYNGGGEPFPYSYEIVKKHVAYVHAKDSCHYAEEIHGQQEFILKRAFDALCVPVGEGAVNWEGVCRSLKRDGFSGPAVVETHIRPSEVDEGFRKGVRYLQKHREAGECATA